MRGLILTVSLLLALVGAARAETPPCHDPAAFGAVPNDGRDDGPAIMQAANLSGETGLDTCIGAGVFNVYPRNAQLSLGNPARLYSIFVTGKPKPVRIRGKGRDLTVLMMTGDGGGGTWHMIGAERQDGFVIEDLTVDGSGRTGGYAEHQNLIQLGYGTRHGAIRRIRGVHPELAAAGGGDCVRLVGGYTESELVQDFVVEDSEFPFCDRSAVSLQRSLRHGTIARIRGSAGDQFIDSEATDAADEFRWIQDVTIRDVEVEGHGGLAISLGRAKRVRFEHSTVHNGSVYVLTGHTLTLRNLNVECPDSSESCLVVRRSIDGVVMENLTLTRPSGAAQPGSLVDVVADSDGAPRNVRLLDSELVQTTSAPALLVRSGELYAAGNHIIYAGPNPGGPNAVGVVINTTVPSRRAVPVVVDNLFSGSFTKGILLGSNLSGTRVVNNSGESTTYGVQCELNLGSDAELADNVFRRADGSVAPNAGCP